MVERLGGEVAADDPRLGLLPGQPVDDRASQLAADARLAGDAAVDMQDGHYCLLSIDLLPRQLK